MLFLHLLRCQRFVLRGLCDRVRVSKMISGASPIPVKDALLSVLPVHIIRAAASEEAAVTPVGSALRRPSRPLFARLEWPWIRHLPRSRSFGHFIAQPITIPVYCGFRMIDGLGHVNNAKYLEICELARWHQLSFLGLGLGAVRRRLAFIVSDVSITYQREIGPRCTVCVVTRTLLAPLRSTMDGPSSSSSSSSLEEASLSDKRRIFVEQEIWSRDGCKLHAALTFAAAIIGPTEYHQELTQRYDPPASAAATHSPKRSPVRPRTALNCEHCLADILGLSSVEELRRLFDSVEHPKRRVSDVGGSAAAATAEEAVAPDQESAGRQEHITRLAQIWRTLRNRMRHKTLGSPPTPLSTSSNAPNSKTDSKL